MKPSNSFLLRWLPFAITITAMSLLVYIGVQQAYRQNANDPQIQLAEDGAQLLATGQPPEIFGSQASMDIAQSLQPFTIIYDEAGKPLTGTGSLNSKIPIPPAGVFQAAKEKGEDRFTWQPMPNVRIATVVSYYHGTKSGFMLVGRSLREVEKREDALMGEVFIVWISCLIATFLLVAFIPAKFSTE